MWFFILCFGGFGANEEDLFVTSKSSRSMPLGPTVMSSYPLFLPSAICFWVHGWRLGHSSVLRQSLSGRVVRAREDNVVHLLPVTKQMLSVFERLPFIVCSNLVPTSGHTSYYLETWEEAPAAARALAAASDCNTSIARDGGSQFVDLCGATNGCPLARVCVGVAAHLLELCLTGISDHEDGFHNATGRVLEKRVLVARFAACLDRPFRRAFEPAPQI